MSVVFKAKTYKFYLSTRRHLAIAPFRKIIRLATKCLCLREDCEISRFQLAEPMRFSIYWYSSQPIVSRLSHAESANFPEWKVGLSNPIRPSQRFLHSCTSLLVRVCIIWITSADWPPDGTDRVNWVSRDIDQG